MLRAALADYLGSEGGLEVVATVRDAASAVLAVERHRPDVALLDVRMPGGGAAAARAISVSAPATSVIALSAYDDAASRAEMLAAGAVRYLVKGDPPQAIVDTIHAVAGELPGFDTP